MNSPLNWFRSCRTPRPQQYVLVRLPSNHLLWLSEEHYQLVNLDNHAVLWMTDGSVEIVPLEYIRLYDPTDIFLWTTEVEYQRRSPEVPEGNDGWPYSAMSIRMMNQHQMQYSPDTNRKRAAKNDYSLSWKKCGF